jgi:membrane-associated phospholipid phosphatase
MRLRAFEWIVVVYFGSLATAAIAVPLPLERRRHVVVTAVLVVASILSLARLGDLRSTVVLRDWIPLTYLLLGYWLPAFFVKTPNQALERALLALDHRWFGPEGLTTFAARAPRVLIELFEVAYLVCYPLVPAGFAYLYVAGPSEEIDRFWTAVLLASFSCYGLVPWLPTRPPRALEQTFVPLRSRVRRLNLRVLGRASIQLNTFPSGHAAASLATALAVGVRLPSAGLVLGLIALGISLGSVLGRYHYAADALSGTALAVLGFLVSRFVS